MNMDCGPLLTDELRRRLPRLYDQENNEDPMVYMKFFTPDSSWTWLVTEGQLVGDDFRFFGYVIGLAEEWATSFFLSSRQPGALWDWQSSATCSFSPGRSARSSRPNGVEPTTTRPSDFHLGFFLWPQAGGASGLV